MKKIIHTLFILDKSTSMSGYTKRTIESINANLAILRKEAAENGIDIFNTLLSFSANNNNWGLLNAAQNSDDFNFIRIGKNVNDIADITDAEYIPQGGTPLLDAIGKGIEKLKETLGDELGKDNVTVVVTIFTDGEENSSRQFSKADIKKMIEHFSSDNKWTFTFVGCGSIDNVTATSANLGIAAMNTIAFADTAKGRDDSYATLATYYTSTARSVSRGEKIKGLAEVTK
jgi:Mg-chelatase subunit ChlD